MSASKKASARGWEWGGGVGGVIFVRTLRNSWPDGSALCIDLQKIKSWNLNNVTTKGCWSRSGMIHRDQSWGRGGVQPTNSGLFQQARALIFSTGPKTKTADYRCSTLSQSVAVVCVCVCVCANHPLLCENWSVVHLRSHPVRRAFLCFLPSMSSGFCKAAISLTFDTALP